MELFRKESTQEPFVVGICGRSCSGKGALTEALASVNREVLLLEADWYFHNTTSCTYRGYQCWEHTDCIAFDRLVGNLHSLKNGEGAVIRVETPWMPQGDIEIPREDMRTKKLIIVDGFLIFAVERLIDLFDYKIFIHTSDVNVLYRRQMRNGVEQINYIHDVVIPVSKEYEQMQKDNADVVIDGDRPNDEVINNTGTYLCDKLSQSNIDFKLGLPPQQLPWKVHPGDLLMDHEWHPTDYEDLKDWVKERKDRLDAGEELKGNTFRYKRNLRSGMYEVRLSHKYTICRYTREPT
jgi:uridine kinase